MRNNIFDCPLCKKLDPEILSQSGFFIHEFEHSVLLVGDHQYFDGYCLLVLKDHVRELHDLDPSTQEALFKELMRAGRAIADEFQPWKMNYSCYGNAVPHIHWHLMPRSESDPDRLLPPFKLSERFESRKTSEVQALEVAARIRPHLVQT